MRYIFWGSNLITLMAAIRSKLRDPDDEVILADKSSSFGANMHSLKFLDDFYDVGMQTYYDSGIEFYDNLVREALTESNVDYNELKWPLHDNSGAVYCGALQKNSAYLNYEKLRMKGSLRDFLAHIEMVEQKNNIQGDHLDDYLFNRFGIDESDPVVKELSQKYSLRGEIPQSSSFASTLPMDRVLVPEISDSELLRNPNLMKYVAFSTRSTSSVVQHERYTIYPKNGGISALFNAVHKYADRIGVRTIYNCSAFTMGLPKRIIIEDSSKNRILCDGIFWGSNLSFFDDDQLYKTFMKNRVQPLKGSIVHARAKFGFLNSDLQYLFDYTNSSINRITFYGAMTSEEKDQTRASIELINSDGMTRESLVNYLMKYCLISNDEITFTEERSLPWPLFMPVGIEEYHANLSDRALEFENLLGLLCSDTSKSSMLMGPTMRRVLKDF